MKKGKIRALCFLIVSALFLGLVGCGSQGGKKIVIALPMGTDKPVWEALAADYTARNPDVRVEVKDRDAAEYSSWLVNGFATGNIEADIVTVNETASYIGEGKFLKLNNYLNRINPYMTNETTGEKIRWRDGLEEEAYVSSLDNKFATLDNGTYCISLDRVQVALFYNKRIFEQCGITQLPRTWDELVAVCETVSKCSNPETGISYTPLAIPGESRALTYYYNWLTRIYTDQYFRDLEPQVAYREGDYYYEEERDGEWKFNLSDINNDKTQYVGFNTVRLASEVNAGSELGVTGAKYAEMMQNFKKIFPKYALPDFIASTLGNEYYYFYNAQAAMILDASWFVTDFPEKMKRSYQTGFKQFDYGILYLPPMGTEVNGNGEVVKRADSVAGADVTRSLGGATGYYGIVNKSKEQNDLSADFLMYWASPAGQKVRLETMKKNKLAPKGTILLKEFEMDAKWQAQLDRLEYRGECDYNPFTAMAAGWMGDEQSKRGYYAEVQKYFMDETILEDALNAVQAELKGGISRWIKSNNYREDCLRYPERNPNQ